MTEILSEDDLNTLMDSLEAWENKDFGSEIIGSIFGAMLTDKNDPAVKAKYDAERRIQDAKMARERTVRKERSLILRAKLLQLRNGRSIDGVQSALTEMWQPR